SAKSLNGLAVAHRRGYRLAGRTTVAMATIGYRALVAREAPAAEYPKPRLLDRVRHAIRARHYSRSTEKTYVHWIKRYIFVHCKRHPAEMGSAEVCAFLTALAVREKVAASPQNQAFAWSSRCSCRGSTTSSAPSDRSTCRSCSRGRRSAPSSNVYAARPGSWLSCSTAPGSA